MLVVEIRFLISGPGGGGGVFGWTCGLHLYDLFDCSSDDTRRTALVVANATTTTTATRVFNRLRHGANSVAVVVQL